MYTTTDRFSLVLINFLITLLLSTTAYPAPFGKKNELISFVQPGKDKILVYYMGPEKLRPVQIYFNDNGAVYEKELDLCTFSNKKNPPILVKVDSALYMRYKGIICQGWATDSLLYIKKYQICVGVWSGNVFSHIFVTADKSEAFLQFLIKSTPKQDKCHDILNNYMNQIFAYHKSNGRCIVLHNNGQFKKLSLAPDTSHLLKTSEELVFSRGALVHHCIGDSSFRRVLKFINNSRFVKKKLSGQIGKGLELLILDEGHFVRKYVSGESKKHFLSELKEVLAGFPYEIKELDDMISYITTQEKIDHFLKHDDTTEDKIVFEQIGERDKIIFPLQFSYKPIGDNSFKGVIQYVYNYLSDTPDNRKKNYYPEVNVLKIYHYQVGLASYKEMVDSIIRGEFQNPVVPTLFNGTIEVTIFRKGELICRKIVSLDNMNTFLQQQLDILKSHGDECEELNTWLKRYSGPLIERIFTILGFPDCCYSINQILFYGSIK